MLGMIIVTHGCLADELLKTAIMIVGPIENSQAICIDQGMSVEKAKYILGEAVTIAETGDSGVIILTDLFGGTPTNLSADFIASNNVEILTGVNLPMVLKCASSRKQLPLTGLAEMLRDYARAAIMRPVELLTQCE